MSLRKQPFFPLYTKDFMTDEKLNECSAESTGVYIRVMCLMHNSDPYGEVLLKQKDQQTDKPVLNFALKLSRQMPYSLEVIERSLNELLEEGVLSMEGNRLFQKRMVRDEKLHNSRASAGHMGGIASQANARANREANRKANDEAKEEANTANANANINNKKKSKKATSKGSKGAAPQTDIFADYAGDDSELLKSLHEFEAMREKIKKPLTDEAKRLAIGKLDRFSAKVRDKSRYKRECLEESILHSWQGLFALKDFQDSPEPPESKDAQPDHPVSFPDGGSWEDLVP